MSINEFITGTNIARVAARLATEDLGLAALVHSDVGSDFAAGNGASVTVPIPGVTTTNTRPVGSTEDYVLGSIAEGSIDVTLTTEAYSAVPLSLAETTLDITSLARQVLSPQARTVAHHIEGAVAAAMAETTVDETIAYDAANPRAAFIRARAVLRGRGVGADRPLVAVVGADIFADLLLAEQIEDDGITQHVAQIAVHESTKVDPGALYVFVREAFVAALRAPAPAEGATHAASVSEEGMALTALRGFQPSNGSTLSILTTFVGVAPLPLPVADYSAGTMTLVPGGGAVAVDTAGA